MMAELDILNGFAGKVISDCIDITINAIKKADKNRKSKNQTIEARIYQVTIDALNVFPYNKYKKEEKVYDAAENVLKELKRENRDYKEAVRFGLSMLSTEITGDICEDFLGILCYEICKEENRDLAVGHIIHQGERISEQQLQIDRHMQEGFKKSCQNEEEILKVTRDVKRSIDEMNRGKCYKTTNKSSLINRAEGYTEKWNKNVFLNDFNEEDENAGINIKLREIYVEECLPHYIWKNNTKSSDKLRNLLIKYVINNNDRKMLLILGQPGIGKSTLITWIMANLVEKKDDIYVYQFSSDLENINWQSKNVLNDIFSAIGLEYDELENKTLILDGFDEIYTDSDRERILNKLNQELKRLNILKSFSMIITCRENYVYNLQYLDCDYIVLQAWDEAQIEKFCRTYWGKCGNDISEDTIQKVLENKEIFGIPLILYMLLALDITIVRNSSIVDVYDQIFSLEKGVIYDRRYDSEHRLNDPEIKEHIYRISQKMAFWMFENNADRAFISQEKFEEICEEEMEEIEMKNVDIQSDTLIGNFFKLKYCEGKGTDELQFVHRSIYEYFVAIYFSGSLHKLKSKEEWAGKLGELLKDGRLTLQMLEFIKYKFDSIEEYNLSDIAKEVFNIMLRDDMTYYVKRKYKNIVDREMNIFSNMLEVVLLWNNKLGELDNKVVSYLRRNYVKALNLHGIDLNGEDLGEVDLNDVDLREANLRWAELIGTYLRRADLSGADLREANLVAADLRAATLKGTDLRGANLRGANLYGADLREADLRGVDLRETDLSGAYLSQIDFLGFLLEDIPKAGSSKADLSEANLNETIFSMQQVEALCEEYDLSHSKVYISKSEGIIDYKNYVNKIRQEIIESGYTEIEIDEFE